MKKTLVVCLGLFLVNNLFAFDKTTFRFREGVQL